MEVAEIAWLAGILDGEGCLTTKSTSERGLSCVVTIESVSPTIIDEVLRILTKNGIPFFVEGPMWRKLSTRSSWRVRIHRKQAVLNFCTLVLPYSVVKKPELLLVQQFLLKASAVSYYHATDEDLQIPAKRKELKRLA
jgi:hypothetical protein